MKLDKMDIEFLENYDMDEFHFDMGLSNYFKDKYGVDCKLKCGKSYLGIIDYSLTVDTFVINFNAKKYYDDNNDCHFKISDSCIEIYDKLKDEVITIDEVHDESKEIIADKFEEKLKQVADFKRERYLRIISNFNSIELTEEEKTYLLWLSGYDNDTEKVFLSIFDKLRNV